MKEIWNRIYNDIKNYRVAIPVAIIYLILSEIFLGGFCPMVYLTGFPCPGCGMTRAAMLLLSGDFAKSFEMNPMVIPVVVFIIYCLFFRYIVGKKIPGFTPLAIILLLAIIGVYAVRMILYFPDRTPLVYYRKNLFIRMVNYFNPVN